MPAVNLFLDTEWADLDGANLVSLALVSQDGQFKLYVERDPLPPPGSEFVEHVVYPLLERGSGALPDTELVERVRAFLASFKSPVVFADHPNDHALLGRILSSASPPVDWVPIFVDQSDVRGHVETYFERRPEARRLRHHAAVDAEALRWAWCYVNEGVG
ncbi:3'-5' exoribonuclease [Pseudoxanthomonas sp.]|uniref:3'-5' exoribonuclease n=1 Tax=Pseudoxanthomonas sp. TaxID=1871049 RepID=UPI00258C98B7|nr:3'-5' exoribonuclease [Pseudoxanthomonas sp.]MCR6687077.1 3'-5' exoribonuclease [Pseudoxanthomonas sp.]